MATYRYSGQAVVADDDILENATGGTFVDANGATIPIFDLNDNPISTISSNAFGQSSSFKANVPMGYIKFGSVLNRVFADEIAQFAVNAQAAIDTANLAATQAAAALQAVNDLIAGGGGGGGGLPAGTTLDQIGDGVTRVAMLPSERAKVSTIPSSFLTLGSTSTTAMRGDRTFTVTDVAGAVANLGGLPRISARTSAQGLPTATEGRQEGDICILDLSA